MAEAVLLSLEAVGASDQSGVCAGVMEIMAVLSATGVRRELLYDAGQAGVLVSTEHGAGWWVRIWWIGRWRSWPSGRC